MGIIVQWDNTAQNIILISFTQPWTWHDFDHAITEMIGHFDSVNHPVDVIFDIRKGGFPPADAITHFKKAAEIQHPNGRRLVYVAPNILAGFVNRIGKILAITNRHSDKFQLPKFTFTSTLEDARLYLAKPIKGTGTLPAIH